MEAPLANRISGNPPIFILLPPEEEEEEVEAPPVGERVESSASMTEKADWKNGGGGDSLIVNATIFVP